MQKFLFILGFSLVFIGLFFPLLKKIPFGNFPGDIFYSSDKFSFAFPIITCILLSIIVTIILNIIK